MTSSYNRRQIFILAIVLYFSIYATSPLIYICANPKSPEGLLATKTDSAYRTDLHIFLYELICSTLASNRSKEISKPITGVLLLKKRAVLSDDEASTLIRLADMADLNERVMFSNKPSILISVLKVYKSSENFQRLSSGLSPPQRA